MLLPDAQRLPTLPAARVSLRALEPSDAPALFETFSDAEVMRYWSHPPFQALAEAEAYAASIAEGFRARSLFQWGVERHEDAAVIGTCTLASLDPRNQRCEVGFVLRRSAWGQGLATEAVTLALDFAFGALTLHRVEADVDPGNAGSLRLLARLGFVREGLLRERWFVGGARQDSVLLGLLAPDWRQRRAG